MKKQIKLLAVLVTFSLMSFTKSTDFIIGTYGVSNSDQIKLTLNSDHTFKYQDLTNQDNKIIVSGNWTFKGKKLVLVNNESKHKFHDTWTFINEGQVAKSRKGLTFYRLCRIDK